MSSTAIFEKKDLRSEVDTRQLLKKVGWQTSLGKQ